MHQINTIFEIGIMAIFLLQSCAISPTKMLYSIFEPSDTLVNCDIYLSDYEYLEKINKREYINYEFKAGDTIAEIGAGNLFFSLANMCFVDSLTFYVQDLSLVCLSETESQKGKEHFTKLRGLGPLKGCIHIVQGDTNRSNLPYNTFDKVILRLVYHEFKNPEQNLQDIWQILKPDGILYVGENVQKKKNKTIKCGIERTEPNLIREIENVGFKLQKISSVSNSKHFKIYKFTKNDHD